MTIETDQFITLHKRKSGSKKRLDSKPESKSTRIPCLKNCNIILRKNHDNFDHLRQIQMAYNKSCHQEKATNRLTDAHNIID